MTLFCEIYFQDFQTSNRNIIFRASKHDCDTLFSGLSNTFFAVWFHILRLSKHYCVTLISGLPCKLRQRIVFAFQGFLSAEDLDDILRGMGFRPSKEELKDILEEIDEDGSGEIEFAEFCQVRSRKLEHFNQNIFLCLISEKV